MDLTDLKDSADELDRLASYSAGDNEEPEHKGAAEGMKEALGRARDKFRLREPVEEIPTKATGDEKVTQLPEMDFSEGAAKAPAVENLSMKLPEAKVDAPHDAPEVAKEPDAPKPPDEPWARIQYELEQNGKRAPAADPLVEKMKSIGWAPADGAKGPDWDALQKGLQDAEHRAESTRAINAALHAVAPRFEGPANAGAEDIAAARAPLEVAKERQAFEHQRMLADQALLEQRKKAERDDAKSAESARQREIFRLRFPGVNPKSLDQMSAAELEELTKSQIPLEKDASEERRTKEKEATAAKLKAEALADRKKLMLSQYPEHAAEINALNDLGDAQTFQTALEGRLGRTETQAAGEKARGETRAHEDAARKESEAFQRSQQARAEAFQKSMKEWEATHRPMSSEQATQLEGINKSDEVLKTFDDALNEVGTPEGKAGAALGKLGGMVGLKGADFPAARHGAATLLARGMEGGTAKPGNVEMLEAMLPEASDSDDIKAKKMDRMRKFQADNADAFQRTLMQGGFRPLNPVEAKPQSAADPLVTLVAKDGRTKSVKKSAAEKFLKEHPGEATIK